MRLNPGRAAHETRANYQRLSDTSSCLLPVFRTTEGSQDRLRQPRPRFWRPQTHHRVKRLRSARIARDSVGELGMTGGRSIDHHFEKLVLALA